MTPALHGLKQLLAVFKNPPQFYYDFMIIIDYYIMAIITIILKV